ncbi:MAG: acyl-ACP desaturase [Nitrososphaerales archaeon]
MPKVRIKVSSAGSASKIRHDRKKAEVLKCIEPDVGDLAKQLTAPEECWQLADLLPDMSANGWHEEIRTLQQAAAGVSDAIFVVLVGNMITEEALPSYQTCLNRMSGIQDRTGTDENGWAEWSRRWTAQENRHGDALRMYLYLSGRVDMRSIDVTIQHLISNGFDPKERNDPYRGFVYTSFQEAVTRLCHTRVGRLAYRAGDQNLGKLCNLIAGEEAIHEKAYKTIMAKIFALDPDGAVLAFAGMLKAKVSMPGVRMDHSGEDGLFQKYCTVAQGIGVYTIHDYTAIIQRLIQHWNLETLKGLTGQAAKAQDFLCSLPERYRQAAVRLDRRISSNRRHYFSWIFNRPV